MDSSTITVDTEYLSRIVDGAIGLPAWLVRAAEEGRRLVMGHDPAHDWGHARRVATLTVRAGAEYGAELLPAVAAGLLHDLVQVRKGTPGCREAGRASAALASDILVHAGAPAPLVHEVAIAIAEHPSSAGHAPSTPLSAALQDGDRLDALGMVGVARTLTVGALLGRPFVGSAHHVLDQLVQLADGMHTAYGRAEAQWRLSQMLEFFHALAEQCGDDR